MNNICAHCRKPVARKARAGLRLFCSKRCFGLDRRKGKTKAQKVAEKRLYDMAYREKNKAMLKAKKAAYFRLTYDPVKAAIERKKRMPLHVAYCRQPRYKAWKRQYDQKRRDGKYGPFAEAARLAIDLNREIKGRMSSYEIRLQNQTLNKRLARTRAAGEAARHAHPRAEG